jgi:beta-lactamase regulating signal transducer with metallopeptidase domain
MPQIAAMWARSLWSDTWQGCCLAAIAWACCRVWPAMPARGRAWLWWIVSAKFLIGLLPVNVPLPILPAVTFQGARADALVVAGDIWHADILPALMVVWLLGVSLSVYRTASSWHAANELRRKANHSQQASVLADCHRLCFYLGIPQCPELLESEDLVNPMLTGVSRPAIILPAAMEGECGIPQLRMILAHELAHLKRRDLVLGWVPAIAQVVNWYNPLVAMASREWTVAQEISCDELAVGVTGSTSAEFGRMVLAMSLPSQSTSGSQRDGGEGGFGPASAQPRSLAVGITSLVTGGPHEMLKRRLCALRYAGSRRGPVGWISNRAMVSLLALCLIPWHPVPVADAVNAITTMDARISAAQASVGQSWKMTHARWVGKVYGCIHNTFGDSNAPTGTAPQGAADPAQQGSADSATPQNSTPPGPTGNNNFVDHQFIYTDN